jgi:hypothetical protein
MLLGQGQAPPRDPTEAEPRLRQALLQGRSAPPPAAIRLRGVVVAEGRPGAAVLEVGDRLVRVAEGAIFTEGGTPWLVRAVTADEVRLEAPAAAQVLVLR